MVEAFPEERIHAGFRGCGIHHGTAAADNLDAAAAQNPQCARKFALRKLHIERGTANWKQSYPHVRAVFRKCELECPARFRELLRRGAVGITGGGIVNSVAVCAARRTRACRRERASKRMVITNRSVRKCAQDDRISELIQMAAQRKEARFNC